VTVALGFELSPDADMASVAVAGAEGSRWSVQLAFYGVPADAVAEAEKLYIGIDNCGLYLDPGPSAGVLDGLRSAGLWLHELSPEDVSAADFQFTAEVRARRVRLGDHPALRESVRAALPRSSVRWAFERRKVVADAGPLNACAFALLGLRRNEAADSPGVWVV
jgi:hypothetical protein